ncbi:hypothetical protein [Bradyrhizobium mercantei]|uniref:hypothetical protein n=1 Tax=Bradyrhizobium mercantei TaxID=1904807 RepID=UPI0013564100|nr:hypothetical protein [Bradyrhizobium mercantei]
MSKGAHTFRQSDVTKAVKALIRAGVQGHVEIADNGRRILVIVGSPEARDNKRTDEWD